MRTRLAVIILCCAFLAGAITGQRLPRRPPDRPATASPTLATSTRTAGPTRSSASATPTAGRGRAEPPVPFGSSRLIQTDDFFQTGLDLSSGPTGSTGDRPLTGCTGAKTMQDLTAGKVSNGAYADGSWRELGTTAGTRLTESVARAVTAAGAQHYVDDLTAGLDGCRYQQRDGFRHLGKPTSLTQHGGTAQIYLSSDVDGAAYGGVAVFRNDKSFGVVELTDAQVDQIADADLMKSMAVVALFRVKDPG